MNQYIEEDDEIEPWKLGLIGGLLSGTAGYFGSKGNPTITLLSTLGGGALGYNLPSLTRYPKIEHYL